MSAAQSAAEAGEYEALLQFVYLAPVGLVQTSLDGEIIFINPISAQLLMPLSRDGTLSNLFTALQSVAPDLRHLAGGFLGQGTVCDAARLQINAGMGDTSDAKLLSLTLVKLDANRLSQVVMNGLRWATSQAQLFEAERELRRRSLYDTLTGLPNRNLFFDRLEQACTNTQRYQIPFAVMMMDLDRFKEVNDTLGHAAGDQVLQHTANRLLAACRHSDTISRLAGD